jgi:hypothetical protein
MTNKIKKELIFDIFLGFIFIVIVLLASYYFNSYLFDKTKTSTNFFVSATYVVTFVLGAVFILYPVIQLLYFFIKGGNKIIEKQYQISDKELLEDYKSATGDGRLRSSVEFSYYKAWDKTIIIPNKDIVWAYKKKLTKTITSVNHNNVKLNELSKRVRYSLVIKTETKKSYEVSFYTEDAVNNILSFYRHVPTMVVGYSDDYKKLYTFHFDKFLDINYNRNLGT